MFSWVNISASPQGAPALASVAAPPTGTLGSSAGAGAVAASSAPLIIDRAQLVNVDGQTQVQYSGIFHSPVTLQSTVNVQVSNTGVTAIPTPLIFVVEGISNPTVTVANADGATTPDGRPLFNLTGQVPGDTLDPGESTANRPLVFSNPNLVSFTVQASVFQQSTTPTPSPLRIEVLADPLGRRFVGVGEGLDITVRAEGTAPVTVELGQRAAAPGSRGQVFYGATGSATTAIVTTSGGPDNSAQIRVRGDFDNPSAFHGDLFLTASISGTEVAATQVTVLKITLDRPVVTVPNDVPVLRTLTSTPATPDLNIDFRFFPAIMQGDILVGRGAPTSLRAKVITLGGAPTVRTGPNGTVQFLMQAGPAGQGWTVGEAFVVYSPDGPGAGTPADIDMGSNRRCDECDPCCVIPEAVLFARPLPYVGEVKSQTSPLYITSSIGHSYNLTIDYRSQVSKLRPLATGDFGVDWGFTYSDDRLIPDGDHVIHFSPEPRTDMFVANPAVPGAFIAPIEFYQELRKSASDDFELRERDGTVRMYRRFSDPNIPGRLVRMEDSDGNFMTFRYERIDPDSTIGGDDKHVLAFVIDSLGREVRYQYYARTSQTVNGRVVTIPHPTTNAGAFGRLARVIDFKGNMDFSGVAESQDFPGQANNRTVSFDYDAEGNLVAVTSPAVLGTPTGNNFPQGKTTRYDYLRQADIPATITGLDRDRLLHNLIAVQAPNETAPDPSNPNLINPREIVMYGTNPGDLAAFDRVISYTLGGINENEMPAGGTLQYSYQFVAPVSITTNDPFLQTTVTDRRGNVASYVYSIFDTLLEQREFTRGFHGGEPVAYVTQYRYNMDKKLLRQIMPEGNVLEYTYDQGNPDRFQQGNLIRAVRTPDPDRGGDQTLITAETVYEPIYQQPAFIVDPRGLDPAFVPPIVDPSGRPQRERYTTRYFYDYQEAAPALVLPLLAAVLDTTQAEVQARLDASGVQLGLGDLNGDGVVLAVSGHAVRRVAPPALLLPGSNQAVIEGDRLQDIVTLFRFNEFGQMTSTVDPEGNVHTSTYFPETDPDGDGVPTPAPADGRVLNTVTGGYLREETRDTASDPVRNNRTNPTPVNIRSRFSYDDVGNVTRMTDGRGIRTDFFVNELNQVVQTIRAADISGTATADPPEPLPLTAFGYLTNVFYDSNDNVVLSQVEDRGNTSNVDGNPPAADLPAGIPGPANPDPVGGPAFVDTVYKYDILNNQIETLQEVANGANAEFLRTRYRYDANGHQVLTILPEGNATSAIYDERDLLFRTTRGALTPPELDPGSPPATSPTLLDVTGPVIDPTNYNVRGGILCQCTTTHYDGNQNVIETVDAADTDGSPDNNSRRGGPGDRTRYVYDGFDRRTSVIDSVGNQTVWQYDPASNVVRVLRFGPVGGASPTSDGPDLLPRPVSSRGGVIQSANLVNSNLLAATENLHDELSRVFQTDRVLFVNTIPTVRPPDVADGATDIGKGNLTPGDNQPIPGVSGVTIIGRVSTRAEYDRGSRRTFTVEDDGDTSRVDYDGADRVVKTRDPERNTVETAYDDNSNVIETRETDVAQVSGIPNEIFLTTYFYDSLDRLQRSMDNIGQTVNYRYDSRGNLVAMADAQGPTGPVIPRRAFSGGALTVNTSNLFGNVTRYVYDGIGRQTRQEVILTALPTAIPSTAGGDGVHIGATLEGRKDVMGIMESFPPTPDTSQGGGDGIIRTGYNWDQNALLSSMIDDQGNVTLSLYDNLNRQVTETKGLTVSTAPLNKTRILGPRNIVTPTLATLNDPAFIPASQIDVQLAAARARLLTVAPLFPPRADRIDDNPPTTIVWGYDPDDNVLILEDENDSESFSKFDALNRRIALRVFRVGQTDSHVGDTIFAPAPVSDPSNPSATFPAIIGTTKQNLEYDGLSRMTRATDNNEPGTAADDSKIGHAYDSLSRVIEETQKIGALATRAVSSAWRGENLRSRLIYPNDRVLVYTYDLLDRLNTVSDLGAVLPTADYDYIGAGRVLQRRYPINGTRMTFLDDAGTMDVGYDGLRRPAQLRHLRADNSLIVGFTHTYDRMNNKLTEGKLHDLPNSESYSDDSADRLVRFRRATGGATPLHSDWTLDGVGNWKQVDAETRQHSSFNEITQRGATPILSDDNGNEFDDGTLTFEWDFLNRLRTVTRKSDGMVIAVYSYEAADRRIRKVVTNSGALNGTTDFYLDSWREIEERNSSDAVTQQYVYGIYIDEPLVLHRTGAPPLFYHQNTLYSTFALTSVAGDIVEGYLYDAYGKATVFTGPGPDGMWFTGDDSRAETSAAGNPSLFTGRRLDGETKLYYYRARYLNIVQGRLLQRDLAGYGNGMNLYEYVGSSPIVWVDPYGLDYLPREKCKEAMQKRKEMIAEVQKRGRRKWGGELERADVGDCRSNSDCEVVSYIVELPHSCETGLAAKIGHTGVGIGDAYYDYGPAKPVGGLFDAVPGAQWWDDPARWPGATSPNDVNLSDILGNLKKISGGIEDIIKIELCVCKEEAAVTKKWWGNLYKEIAAGKAEYCIPGLHCTSAVMRSSIFAGQLFGIDSGVTTPEEALFAFSSLKHRCGSNKGKYAKVEHIQSEKDPYG